MNKTLEDFARKTILEKLQQIPETSQQTFRLMYGKPGNEKSPLADIVAAMPCDALDWALTQVENTIQKNVEKSLGMDASM